MIPQLCIYFKLERNWKFSVSNPPDGSYVWCWFCSLCASPPQHRWYRRAPGAGGAAEQPGHSGVQVGRCASSHHLLAEGRRAAGGTEAPAFVLAFCSLHLSQQCSRSLAPLTLPQPELRARNSEQLGSPSATAVSPNWAPRASRHVKWPSRCYLFFFPLGGSLAPPGSSEQC